MLDPMCQNRRILRTKTPVQAAWRLVLCFFLVFLIQAGGNNAQAQEDLFLVFGSVKIEESSKRLQGVRVVVLQDGQVFDELMTDAKGDYEFELPLRHDYEFSFEFDGHSNKRIQVDASGIPMDVKGNRNMDLDMTMFPLPEGFDASIFENPYGKGEYDDAKNTVVFDSNFTVRMRNKVQAEFARLERMEGELEQMQDNFEAFLDKGDKAMRGEDWQGALDMYDSALSLFPEDATAISKREQAQVKLDLANASGQSEAAFQALLSEGESALAADRLDDARSAFESAAEMKPGAPEPEQGFRDIEAREVELEQDGEYLELIAEADNFFDREQYDKAIKVYTEASGMKPAERHPRDRKKEAQIRLDDIASQAADIVGRTVAYEALIDEANDLYRDDDYASALVKYEEASELLPAERLPQDRAQVCRERLAEAEEEESASREREAALAARESLRTELREKREQYDTVKREADVLFRNDDYAAAIGKYEEALEVLPDERYPMQRITEAQERLAEADAKETARASKGKGKDKSSDDRARSNDGGASDDQAAREAAREARETEKAAASEARASEALENQSAAESLDVEFEEFVEQGNGAFEESLWDVAKDAYEAALELKPGDRYVTSRLNRIESAKDVVDLSDSGADNDDRLAALEADRLAADQEMQMADEDAQAKRDAERQRRMDEEAANESDEANRRRDKEEAARNRAQELASAMNSQEDDEVERYYQEALKSEDRARMMEVEERKAQDVALKKNAAVAARSRAEEEMNEMEDLKSTQAAMMDDGEQAQSRRLEDSKEQQSRYDEEGKQLSLRGRRLMEDRQEEANELHEGQAEMKRDHRGDYALAVPEMVAKKRNWRNLFRGIRRSAEDRRNVKSDAAQELATTYRDIGQGADIRMQERWLETKRKEKKNSQFLAERESQASQRAYEEKKERESKVNTEPRSPEAMQLSEADSEILMGIHEQSYDIPNGLVVERTVRKANKVVRYRKVVTKTGVYYFKGESSITIDTWKRETSVILD
jgi:hypothetical protein